MPKHLTATSRKSTLGRLFLGPAPILPGEDAADYDELLAQVSSSVKPSDVIEELWLRDCVDLTWQIFRMRRLKEGLITTALLEAIKWNLSRITDLQEDRMNALIEEWSARKPSAMKEVEEYLSSANVTFDAVLARAFLDRLDPIERIDRLLTIAEGRRNAVIREIERRRASFAQALREGAHNFKDSEFETSQPRTIARENARIKGRP